jgi:hypothetical protein
VFDDVEAAPESGEVASQRQPALAAREVDAPGEASHEASLEAPLEALPLELVRADAEVRVAVKRAIAVRPAATFAELLAASLEL